MASLYSRPDIYDLFENSPTRWNSVKQSWINILGNRKISTLLDVSIGTGGLTLPLSDLGISLSGSDLSAEMLNKCAAKAAARSIPIKLVQTDFRRLGAAFASASFDCVASTGNSLPYVTNKEIMSVLAQMDALVKPGGSLYFDMRSWDKILEEKQRFYVYNPQFTDDARVNVIQLWDYNSDGSMTFNIIYTFERDNRIFQKEIFQEHYWPISRQKMLDRLEQLGYSDVQQLAYPALGESMRDVSSAGWYCVIARKNG